MEVSGYLHALATQRTQVPFEQETGQIAELIRTFLRREKSFSQQDLNHGPSSP
jgi:hypothetical protein